MHAMSALHRLACVLVVTLLVVVTSISGGAQSDDDIAALIRRISELYSAGRFGEAIPLAERSVELTRARKGGEHLDTAATMTWLALLYRSQGRYGEAESLYEGSLALFEKALGPDHPQVATSLNNLALLYRSRGRTGEAESLYKRSLVLYEKALGPDHPQVATALNNLAMLYNDLSRYVEAEPLFKRSLYIYEKALGPDDPQVATTLNNLAALYIDLGRYAEAEPLFKRSLRIREKVLGPDHPEVGTSLANLAELYRSQGRTSEAEPLYKRSLALLEKALGPDHLQVATTLNNLALLYERQGRTSEAEPLYSRSLSIREKVFGPDHPEVGTSLNNLALLYERQGRTGEAERLFKRSISISEKALGPDHPEVATSLNSLAELYRRQGRVGEAEPLFERSLAFLEKALGPDHPQVATSLSNLAGLYLVQRDWVRASDYWRRSTALTVRRAQRGTSSGGGHSSGKGKSETDQFGHRFHGLVKVVNRLASEQRSNSAALTAETFATAQWAQGSEAAASLAQMAVRGAARSPRLGTVVRERQDLLSEWQRRDGARTAAVSQPPDKRERQAELANVTRLTEIDARIAEIDTHLKAEFPDYASLASSDALTVEQVQVELRPDEALVLFLDTQKWDPIPEETFIWVVTKTDVRWLRSDLGKPALTREVAALRCGLDATAWLGDGAKHCAEVLRIASDKLPKPGAPLPFDHARAHKLYMALFGEVVDLIKDRHLLLVPSGPLTRLPFQVLVTEAPKSIDHKTIRWLTRNHALTVLPSVSSLKALRRVAKPSAAKHPMIGFGNPLLSGDQRHPQYGAYDKDQAALARAHKGCAQAVTLRTAALRGASRGLMPISQQAGLADVDQIRRQSPLPETADELCAVARDLGADVGEVRIGARATEREIKALSASGRLADYRILHFATHGALAGQLSGTDEPGLILTPPEKATEDNDGYLSAGEIAGLKLDADWVILSACNTAGGAGGGEAGAEALSGLARAFFYAQARALLVSHWEVDSAATVKLITSAVGAITRDKTIGRAEALRRAMLAMIDKGEPRETHPAAWAPFIVVGEGAAAR
jgi:tetratricopeptide (TPR) repeat protein/CHAT domain-containing protein